MLILILMRSNNEKNKVALVRANKNLIRRAESNSIMREREFLMNENFTQLNVEVENLKESLRQSEHSSQEVKLMRVAMENLSNATSDELRSVVVDSSHVTIDKMIGKGGFGEVHLGTLNGKEVAVKRLLDITEENLGRFRFECFLLINLRHPNIVRLVGVCW